MMDIKFGIWFTFSSFLFLISIFEIELVKLSIKSVSGNWCIRSKDSFPIIDKCFWKQDLKKDASAEIEQTFDVHPADVEDENSDGGASVPFLIRLSKRQTKPTSSSPPLSNIATSCLSSISSNLTVEKCHLRKSRFRLSPTFLPKLHSNFCNQTKSDARRSDIRYKLYSSDLSCLKLITTTTAATTATKNTSEPLFALEFSKCASQEVSNDGKRKRFQLWQLCTQSGNCSLSPFDLNWSLLIKVEETPLESDFSCKGTETSTIPTSSVSQTAFKPVENMLDLDLNTTLVNNSTGLTHNNSTLGNSDDPVLAAGEDLLNYSSFQIYLSLIVTMLFQLVLY